MWFIGHRCNPESIAALIAAGADVNFVNEEGKTALDLAQSPQCTDQVLQNLEISRKSLELCSV